MTQTVIAVMSGKGGSGKTTTTLGLAATFAASDQPTLIVDLDPQDAGGASWWLDQATNNDADEGVSYIRSNASELVAGLSTIEEQITLIDTPPRLDDQALATVARLADLILVVAQPSPLDVSSAIQTVATVARPSETPYLLVFTAVDSRSLGEAHEARNDLVGLGHPVAGAVIRRLAAVRRAGFDGVLPTTVDERHAQDLTTLATEIRAITR